MNMSWNWSGIRKKLEQNYLADCLRGRIQYFVTRYREAHDGVGRACIRLDGKEILQGCHFHTERYWTNVMDDHALDLGAFDEGDFYAAFQQFNNQSIEKSLNSENLIVRIFAVLDRRVGKRTLLKLEESIQNEPVNFQTFYAIRMEAEGLLQTEEC